MRVGTKLILVRQPKKLYKTPRLEVYGDLRAITRAVGKKGNFAPRTPLETELGLALLSLAARPKRPGSSAAQLTIGDLMYLFDTFDAIRSFRSLQFESTID